MSAYVPTDWADGTTPLNETNLDKIEQGIKSLSDIVLATGGRLAATAKLITDWNAATQTGWYRAAGSATNSPGPGVAAVGMVVADSANYLIQIAWAHNDVTPPSPRFWHRTRIGGTWGEWTLFVGGGGGGAIEYENAWAAGTAYQAGDVVEHEGVEYLAVNDSTGEEPVPAGTGIQTFTPIPLVTALPASPFDGQEVILTDSLTVPTYIWRLRYVAAKASNKWVFVGGSAMSVGPGSVNSPLTTSWVNQNVSTANIPVSGNYRVHLQMVVEADAGTAPVVGMLSFSGGGFTGAENESIRTLNAADGAALEASSSGAFVAALTAGSPVVSRGRKGSGSVGCRLTKIRLEVTPVEVGG